MARFFGKVGYSLGPEEIRDGVWEDVVVEHDYFGDIVRNTLRFQENADSVNDNLSISHSIEIVADAFANENISAIRYVEWAGSLWTVENVEVRRPRLILRLKGVYNGPTPTPSDP